MPPQLSLDDREAIRDLRARFSDAANLRQHDAFAALFAADGVWAVPDMQVRFEGRVAIRAGIEHMLGLWTGFVQLSHEGPITATADGATGRTYVEELGSFQRGGSQHNYSVYDDRYVREQGEWRFAQREYHFLYVDETPLPGRLVALPETLQRTPHAGAV